MAERGPAYGWDGGNQMLDDLVDQENEQKEKEKREGFSAADELKDLNEDGSDPEAQSPIEAAPPEAPTAPDHIPSAELPLEDGHERLAPDPKKPEDGGDQKEAPIRIAIGDIDKAVEELARMMADEKMAESAREGNLPKRMMRAIWRGTLGREYTRQKFIREAKEEILGGENGPDLYSHEEGVTEGAHQEAMNAVFERLQEGFMRYGEEYGEMEQTEATLRLQNGVRNILRRYATDELSTEAMREEKTRLLAEIQEEYPDFIGGASALADNIETAAEQVMAVAGHQESLDRLLESIEFYEAVTRLGAETEVSETTCDKIIEKLTKSRFGSAIASETTIASAVAIIYSGVQMAGMRGASTLAAVAMPGMTGVAGGAFAGMREGASFRRERMLHLRQRATGSELPEGERRAQMEETRYETIGARESIDELRRLTAIENKTPEQRAELAALTSSIMGRQRYGDEHNADLIAYSSPAQVERERLELHRALADSICQLTEWGQTATPEELAQLGAGENIGEVLQNLRQAQELELRSEVNTKDDIYKSLRRKAIGKAVIKGTLIGVGVGTVFQEATSFIRADQQGAVESLVKGGGGSSSSEAHRTLLAGVFGVKSGGDAAPTGFHLEKLRNGEVVKLSDGTFIKHTEQGMDLMRGKADDIGDAEMLVKNIEVGRGGTISEQSRQALAESGLIESTKEVPIEVKRPAIESTSVREFYSRMANGGTKVERTLFMDNDTRAFDQNELRLWWGSGGGVDSNGNYVLDVSHMTPKGSFHEGLSTDAMQQAQEGKLKLLISPDAAHQHRPVEIPINTDGKAVIDKDSAVGRSLFSRNGDRAISRARYIEVAQVVGNKGGREQVHILATLEGKGVDSIKRRVMETVESSKIRLTITDLGGAPETMPTDLPPIITTTPRKEMEPNRRPEEEEAPTQEQPPVPPPIDDEPPPPPKDKEPAPKKKPPLRISSRIGIDEEQHYDPDTEFIFQKIMHDIMESVGAKRIDTLVERNSKEKLVEKYGETIPEKDIDDMVERIGYLAEARKEELAIENKFRSRLRRKDPVKSVEELYQELLNDGTIAKKDDNGNTTVSATNLSYFARAAYEKYMQIAVQKMADSEEKTEPIPESS